MAGNCSCGEVSFEDPSFDSPGGDTAVLLAAVPVVVIQLIVTLVSTRSQWARFPRAFLAAVRRCMHREGDDGSAGSDPDVEACVAKKCRERLEKSTHNAIRLLAPTFAFVLATVCHNIYMKEPRPFSLAQTWLLVGFCVILTFTRGFISTRPGLLYSAVMLFACGLMAFARPIPMWVFMTDAFALMIRLGLGIRYPSVKAVAFWNLMYACAASHLYWLALGDGYVGGVLCYEAWSFATIAVLCLAASKATEADVRREVEASMLRGESSGLWNLLDMVCDVVVPLGEDLSITDKASRFKAMVTLQEGSVEGARLQDFMPDEEDQRAFERCTAAHAEEDGGLAGARPSVLHVSLKDNLGNSLRVELFCVTFKTPVARRFFVGIREFSDPSPIAEVRSVAPRRRPRRRRAPRSEGGSPARSDDGSSSEGSGTGTVAQKAPAADAAPAAARHTTDVGIELALVQVMGRSILPADSAQCCPFHHRARYFQERLGKIAGFACATDFGFSSSVQCGACGLLVVQDGVQTCFACDADLRVPPRPKDAGVSAMPIAPQTLGAEAMPAQSKTRSSL